VSSRRRDFLMVRGVGTVDYPVDSRHPIRSVDRYLARLVEWRRQTGGPQHPDVDRLLDARLMLMSGWGR